MHCGVGHLHADLARGHEGTGWTSLNTLAAAHAARSTHRIVKIEHDLGLLTAKRVTNDIVHLLLATRPQAARALDAGIQPNRNPMVGIIGSGLMAGHEARHTDIEFLRPGVELAVQTVSAIGHVGEQQLYHHFLRGTGACIVSRHLHAWCRLAAT